MTDRKKMTSIVFIDATVVASQELLATLSAQHELVVINAGQDGVEQIAEALESREAQYAAVHILSHGAVGEINLGAGLLSSATLAQHRSSLARIAAQLPTDADVLIYGCDVGSGEQGRQFMRELSAQLGADVAASDDATGPSALGGDAELEVKVGSVEATEVLTGLEWDNPRFEVANVLAGPRVVSVTGRNRHRRGNP